MDEVRGYLITCRNLCEVALLLVEWGEQVEKDSKLATILEELFSNTQAIIDDNCVFWEEVDVSKAMSGMLRKQDSKTGPA